MGSSKISDFTHVASFENSDLITFVRSGTNYIAPDVAENDYFEVFVENNSDTVNAIVEHCILRIN